MARPPDICRKTVRQLLLKLYPFAKVEESTVKQLVSYEDRNFYFKGVLGTAGSGTEGEDGRETTGTKEFVLKIFNVCSKYEHVEGVNKVLKHLKSKHFQCCNPITSRKGVDVEVLSENQIIRGDPDVRAGRKTLHCISVLSYISGELLCDVIMTKKLGYEVGMLVGSMDAQMQV